MKFEVPPYIYFTTKRRNPQIEKGGSFFILRMYLLHSKRSKSLLMYRKGYTLVFKGHKAQSYKKERLP